MVPLYHNFIDESELLSLQLFISARVILEPIELIEILDTFNILRLEESTSVSDTLLPLPDGLWRGSVSYREKCSND